MGTVPYDWSIQVFGKDAQEHSLRNLDLQFHGGFFLIGMLPRHGLFFLSVRFSLLFLSVQKFFFLVIAQSPPLPTPQKIKWSIP